MRFSNRYPIQHSAEQVWALISDPYFSKESYELANADYDILSESIQGQKRLIQARIRFRAPLPAIAKKLLGREHLSYIQNLELDPQQKKGSWTIKVEGAGSKVQANGHYQILPSGEHSFREFAGEVRVSIPFVGGKIEKEIAKKLEEGQRKSIEIIEKKLAG